MPLTGVKPPIWEKLCLKGLVLRPTAPGESSTSIASERTANNASSGTAQDFPPAMLDGTKQARREGPVERGRRDIERGYYKRIGYFETDEPVMVDRLSHFWIRNLPEELYCSLETAEGEDEGMSTIKII